MSRRVLLSTGRAGVRMLLLTITPVSADLVEKCMSMRFLARLIRFGDVAKKCMPGAWDRARGTTRRPGTSSSRPFTPATPPTTHRHPPNPAYLRTPAIA